MLVKRDGAPLEAADFGWYYSKARSRLTTTETAKPANAGCRFWVNSKNSESSGVLPVCLGMKAPSSMAGFAAALAPEMRARVDGAAGGGDCRWALLKNQEA